jgi:PAS domain S-box-containing protein
MFAPVEVAGYVNVYGLDVTDRVELEDALRKLSRAVEQSPSTVVITDTTGDIEYVNPKFTEITGYTTEEVQGENPRLLKADVQSVELYKELWDTIQAGGEWRGEFANRRRDGELYWEFASISPIKDQRGNITHFLKVAEDITERKLAEEALRQRTLELEERNEELDAFSHTVAHDLKNPLSLLIGFTEFLVEEYETLPTDQVSDHLRRIARIGRKMGNIVDELLLLAGVRKMEVEFRPIDMEAVVAAALERLSDLLQRYDAELALPETWPQALGYGPWVEEVWANYISNAVKYGGRPPCLELGAESLDKGMVRFWIQDNGRGLNAEQQEQVFTPFTQLGQAHAGGHGLGLSIVHRIVEKLGGHVAVESTGVPGEGSRFSFTLVAEGHDDP